MSFAFSVDTHNGSVEWAVHEFSFFTLLDRGDTESSVTQHWRSDGALFDSLA